MADDLTHEQGAVPSPDVKKFSRTLLESQFALYRRIVAKKHNLTIWLDFPPGTLPDAELEQAVAFLRDAAHLPPA